MLPVLLAAVLRYDVLLSAGHEGRPASCAHFPTHHCNLGTAGEMAWTPVVVDEAARILRSRGYRVAREPADFDGTFDVTVALFVHFDGTSPPCGSGASIGYHTLRSQTAARMWRNEYSRYFPFRMLPDNFTDNLRDYYGFRQVNAEAGALVVELGELTCPPQRAWLAQHLPWEGRFIANFVTSLIQWEHAGLR